jgi:peptidylprolyl isomerase
MNAYNRGLITVTVSVFLVAALATACSKKESPAPGKAVAATKVGAGSGKKAETGKAVANAADNSAKPEAAAAAVKPSAPERPAVQEAERLKHYNSVDWTDEKAVMAAAKGPAGLPAPPDVAATPTDAQKTASGLASRVLKKGTGTERPGPRDVVKCHYIGWQTDGKNFDASYKNGEPISFPLNRVIAGWTEGLQLMVAGEKRRFWIPESLAYGGRPGAPSGMLVFDVELLSFDKAPEPPKVPADVAAIPKDAKVEKSGLASKVLKKGTGSTKPTAASVVEVHYSGWTTDGKMFDSSVSRGQPAQFPLNRVIPGWTAGLQLFVEGEKRRLWIPEEMAYKGRAGAPQGMLVFDVELLRIIK